MSVLVNADSGKVVHEVVTDGSVYYGADSSAGNTDETAKFPSALALVWRWSGDNAFRDELYPLRGPRHATGSSSRWTRTATAGRRGSGTWSARAWATRSSTTPLTIRGLYDLADLAARKGDAATAAWARSHAREHGDGVRGGLVDAGGAAARRLARRPGQREGAAAPLDRRTPMEIELVKRGRVRPGLTAFDHGNAALDVRERPCYSRRLRALPHRHAGLRRRPARHGRAADLLAQHRRDGRGRGQLRPPRARASSAATRRRTAACSCPTRTSSPATCPRWRHHPPTGARSTGPSTTAPMVLQAWGTYGTLWPVVHQQLGVRPDMGRRRLELMPQVPQGQSRIGGREHPHRRRRRGRVRLARWEDLPDPPACAPRWPGSCSATRCRAVAT